MFTCAPLLGPSSVQHEGDLDAVSSPQAASVVAMFGNLCRNMPRDVLVDMLQGNFSNVALLEVMHGDAEGKVGAKLPTQAPLKVTVTIYNRLHDGIKYDDNVTPTSS